MAAAMMRHRVAEAGLSWEIDSAGIYAGAGHPMAKHATDVLIRRHIVVQTHASKPVTPALIERADLILTMTKSHRDELVRQYPHATEKVHTLKNYADGVDKDFVDPFGGDEHAYEACADALAATVDRIFARLQSEAS